MTIDFSSAISENDLCLLFDLGGQYSFDPLYSDESEKYFVDLLQRCTATGEGKKRFLELEIFKDFKFNIDLPRWTQNPEWPFDEGKPMFFVGQLELVTNRDGNRFISVFYVFSNLRTGKITTICQTD